MITIRGDSGGGGGGDGIFRLSLKPNIKHSVQWRAYFYILYRKSVSPKSFQRLLETPNEYTNTLFRPHKKTVSRVRLSPQKTERVRSFFVIRVVVYKRIVRSMPTFFSKRPTIYVTIRSFG